jgi:hypothetical protein
VAFFDAKRWLAEPAYAIKITWVTSIVVACLTLLMIAVGLLWPPSGGAIAPVLSLVDVALVLGLGYGVRKHSRVCAILLVVYWIMAKIDQAYRLQAPPRFHAFLIGFIFLMGARATFQIRGSAQSSGEDRYKPPPAAT